ARADGPRLRRLARFLGRHFYRERIVRLFAASRALARGRGRDPLALLDAPGFGALLDAAELGSSTTADGVAALVEAALEKTLADLPYAGDLVRYEGALFRAEAGPRRWGDGGLVPDGIPVRAESARVVTLAWDVAGLVAAVRRGDRSLPVPPRVATRLLIALSPDGRVTTVRCSDAVERLLGALDGARAVEGIARLVGVAEAHARDALRQLTAVGAVAWRPSP
ncbi:MAG: hypothetical protein ACRELA_02540, partial [Candidatus Rokuibacteriota bacterium]